MENQSILSPVSARINPNQDLVSILNSISAVVFVIKRDGSFQFVSEQSTSIWGYNPKELIGTPFIDVIAEDEKKRTSDYFDNFIMGHPISHFENHIISKNGEMIPVSWSSNWKEEDQCLYVVAREIKERKKVYELQESLKSEIKAQHQHMTDILERISDGFFAVDNNWTVTYWNNRAEKIVGVSKEKVLSKGLWDCFPQSEEAPWKVNLRKAMSEQTPVYFEAMSTVSPLLLEISAYPSENGLTVFYRDITQRKETQEQLRRLSLVASETVNSVLVTNPDDTIKWVNEAFTRFTGYSAEEAMNKKPGDLLNGIKTDRKIIAFIKDQKRKGETYQCEILQYKKNGEAFWSEIYGQPVFDDKGQLVEFFSIKTDITERKIREEQLNNLSLIVKETKNAVTLISSNGIITWANPSFTKITGFEIEDAIGKKAYELLSGHLSDQAMIQKMKNLFLQGKSFFGEIIAYRKDGETIWLECFGQPLFNNEGQLQNYFLVLTDITMKKKLEIELIDQQKKMTAVVLKAQEEERSQIGRELHDNINQVLTTVKLYAELTRDGLTNTKEMMDKSIQLLQASINEIRGLSKRLSAPSLGKIRLCDSVHELIETIRTTGKIEIQLDVSKITNLEVSEDLHINVYRIMQEHLTNILRHADASHVGITIDHNINSLNIRVDDNGKGFDPCIKGDGSGIANMRSRAEGLHGMICIKSYPGKGCMLDVNIPLSVN